MKISLLETETNQVPLDYLSLMYRTEYYRYHVVADHNQDFPLYTVLLMDDEAK